MLSLFWTGKYGEGPGRPECSREQLGCVRGCTPGPGSGAPSSATAVSCEQSCLCSSEPWAHVDGASFLLVSSGHSLIRPLPVLAGPGCTPVR